MKANEAPKSKFVYPDKLYARTKDNITLDISYAPQTLEAVEYVRTEAFIEKLECWLYEKGREYCGEFDEGFLLEFNNSEEAIKDFINYMRE